MKIIYEKANIIYADEIWYMLNKLDNETKFMMFERGERKQKSSLEKLKVIIENSVKENDFFLIAKYDEKVVGFISANRGKFNRIKHSAYVVLGILQDFRGKGIGNQFLKKLDIWAKENRLIRLELTVMKYNNIAKSLYEKNGFVVEGIRKKSMYIDNEFVDEYYMAKMLK